MGNSVQQTPQQQQQQQRQQYSATQKPRQMQIENALNTLQSMFVSVDRSVLRMILMEQCQGNVDLAVETLLAMSGGAVGGGTGTMVTASKPKTPTKPKEVLYDANMRPIIVSDDFLQPPSYLLQKYLNITLTRSYASLPRRKLTIDPSIVAQWNRLMTKYKFKNEKEMDRVCKSDCSDLSKCGSLIRIIFMMKLYQNLCNGASNGSNYDDGELIHAYLTNGFKEYSLIQLINDCNHCQQYHNLTHSDNLNLKTIQEKNQFEQMMTEYFGHCDIMSCKVIKRIFDRQDNDDNKNKKADIDVERDVVDKYHRVFYHPMN